MPIVVFEYEDKDAMYAFEQRLEAMGLRHHRRLSIPGRDDVAHECDICHNNALPCETAPGQDGFLRSICDGCLSRLGITKCEKCGQWCITDDYLGWCKRCTLEIHEAPLDEYVKSGADCPACGSSDIQVSVDWDVPAEFNAEGHVTHRCNNCGALIMESVEVKLKSVTYQRTR